MTKVMKTAFLLIMIMGNTVMCMGNTGEKAKENITSSPWFKYYQAEGFLWNFRSGYKKR